MSQVKLKRMELKDVSKDELRLAKIAYETFFANVLYNGCTSIYEEQDDDVKLHWAITVRAVTDEIHKRLDPLLDKLEKKLNLQKPA
jgi:hypothetical protein